MSINEYVPYPTNILSIPIQQGSFNIIDLK